MYSGHPKDVISIKTSGLMCLIPEGPVLPMCKGYIIGKKGLR